MENARVAVTAQAAAHVPAATTIVIKTTEIHLCERYGLAETAARALLFKKLITPIAKNEEIC